MIKLNGITKEIENRKILNALNFTFPDKGFFQIQGENGCGKTTLLNILSLLDNKFEGSVSFDDKTFSASSDEKEKTSFRVQSISYVFPNNNLISFMTVEENFKLYHLSTDSIKNFIDLKQYPSTLSGGENLLVSLAKELQKNTKIVLLDEVTSQLDDFHFKKIQEILSELGKERLVISVTHDKRIQGRMLRMIGGKLIWLR